MRHLAIVLALVGACGREPTPTPAPTPLSRAELFRLGRVLCAGELDAPTRALLARTGARGAPLHPEAVAAALAASPAYQASDVGVFELATAACELHAHPATTSLPRLAARVVAAATKARVAATWIAPILAAVEHGGEPGAVDAATTTFLSSEDAVVLPEPAR